MLDEVLIFRKSGIVLWRHSWVPIKGSPVNQLIQQVLLEVRACAPNASGSCRRAWRNC